MAEGGTADERRAGQRLAHGPRRRLLARTSEPGAAERAADLQALLAQTLGTLLRETRVERAAVWARDPNGRGVVLAALGESEIAGLAGLDGPADLGAAGAPEEFAKLARRSGLSAAAPVGSGREPFVVLVLGGSADPPGAVRPRTLAALGAAAERLRTPLAASASLGRLARLDAEVRRLDRLAALGELVAEIVHEIRNPLVSVKTFLQLLPERASEPEFQGRFREVAAEELRRIERLLDLVLAHARPGTAARESDHTLLSGSCQSVLQLVSHRAADLGVSLELAGASPPLRVALSDDALRQVVLNLVLNALDVTPRGGRVRLALAAAGGQAELRVEDDGPGVPEALRERVFEAFYSSKPGAPGGLGLAITRRIVEEAGGSIAALPGAPGGGCFRVRLPLG
jgi:signal transduction histidine kinase